MAGLAIKLLARVIWMRDSQDIAQFIVSGCLEGSNFFEIGLDVVSFFCFAWL